jgi:hypothetical protein
LGYSPGVAFDRRFGSSLALFPIGDRQLTRATAVHSTLNRRPTMDDSKQIASLSLHVDPEALRSIISSGRLLEFADTVATQAAAQISAQLVQRVADGALRTDGLKEGVSAAVSYRLVTGDGEPGFGTVPRPPRFGVGVTQNVQSGLRQMAVSTDSEASD